MKTLLLKLAVVFMAVSPISTALSNENSARLQSVTLVKQWEANKIQEVKLELLLPAKFHAYTDQFRVLDLDPATFKAGQISVKPEVEFFDKFSKKKRKGFFEKGFVTVLIEAPENILNPEQNLKFNLRYQMCSESVCYLPQTLPIEVRSSSVGTAESAIGSPIKESFSLLKSFEKSLQSNLWLAFISVFIAGILTSFTPCIFPMLPITISILGYHADKKNRWHNFTRALFYVLGIALTYSLLGVIAALTGSLFGSALSSKYVVGALVILFFTMAFSMWGAFELQAPAFIRNRFGTGKSHGLLGAFTMGLVAGLVASPCVGPVLVSILSYVSTTRDAVLGFFLLFTFALGLGTLFIVIGLFSSALRLLPKSGKWMDFIKFILGACMWGAALYYAQFVFAERWWTALVALSFVAFSVWKGAFNFKFNRYLRQSFLMAVFIFSLTVLLLSLFKHDYLSSAFQISSEQSKKHNQLNWVQYSEEALNAAVQSKKPVFLDFYADWCGACHELAEKTFSTEEFMSLSDNFVLMRFDATQESPEVDAVLKKYSVKGLPTVVFIDKSGYVMHNLTFTQFLEMKDLKPLMMKALE